MPIKLTDLVALKGQFDWRIDRLEAEVDDAHARLDTATKVIETGGADGKDGRDGKDGAPGRDGRDGKDGADGKDGEDGKDGVSVVDAELDFDQRFRFTLSNGAVLETKPLDIEQQVNNIVSHTRIDQTSGGGSDLAVLDEGVSLSTAATSIDFVGAGVSATNVGDAITVTISGGGGGGHTITSVGDVSSPFTARSNLDFDDTYFDVTDNAGADSTDVNLSTAAQTSLGKADTALQPSNNLSDVAVAATARSNLGLEIGVDVEAFFTKNTGFNLALGTGAGQVAEGNHLHTGVYEPADATILKDADIGVTVEAAFSKNTGFNLALGTGAGQVAEGNHTHPASAVVSGTFADARIAASNVTQHQAALSLAASQISSGTLVHERGGLEADVSAYSGLLKISGGATSQAVAGTDYLTDVVQDTSPELGGNLGGGGFDITNLRSINLGNDGNDPTSHLLVYNDSFSTTTALGVVPRFADAAPTVNFTAGGNGFGVGFLFYAHPNLTWSGGTNFGAFYILADQTELSLDQTTNRTMSGSTSVFINPNFNCDNTGTLTITSRVDAWYRSRFQTGVTATTYNPVKISGPEGTGGTVTNFAGLNSYLSDITPTNYAHILLGTSAVPSGKYHIYTSGDFPTRLGGDLTVIGDVVTMANLPTSAGATGTLYVDGSGFVKRA